MPASKKRFAMQFAPEADGAELIAIGERFVGEVGGHFFGREIDIGEDHHAGVRLFDDLRTPTGFAAGVETLAALEAHLFEHGDQMRERGAAGAVGVMIVVGPAEAERGFVVRIGRRRPDCGFASTRARRRRTSRRPSRCRCPRPRRRIVRRRGGNLLRRVESSLAAAGRLRDGGRPRRFACGELRDHAETGVAVAFDEPKFGVDVVVDHGMAIHAAAWADDLFGVDRMEAEHGRQCQASSVDAIAAERQAGAAALTMTGGNIPSGCRQTLWSASRLLCVADVGQFADEAERSLRR